MLDRAFGKAVNRTELMGKDGGELKGTVVYLPQAQETQINDTDLETTSQTGNSIT